MSRIKQIQRVVQNYENSNEEYSLKAWEGVMTNVSTTEDQQQQSRKHNSKSDTIDSVLVVNEQNQIVSWTIGDSTAPSSYLEGLHIPESARQGEIHETDTEGEEFIARIDKELNALEIILKNPKTSEITYGIFFPVTTPPELEDDIELENDNDDENDSAKSGRFSGITNVVSKPLYAIKAVSNFTLGKIYSYIKPAATTTTPKQNNKRTTSHHRKEKK
jgi:hypothetical protein